LTNTVDPDEGAVWGAILVAMAAMFVAALAGRPRRLRPSRFGIAPMVAGIVLFAFATKATLAHVGDELDTIPALGLCGGPPLYLLAYVALRLRVSRTLGRGRLVAAVACALLVPVAVVVPTLVALVAVVWVALHAYEIICWREARARTRALRLPAFVS